MGRLTLSKVWVVIFVWTLTLLFTLVWARWISVFDSKKIIAPISSTGMVFSDVKYRGGIDKAFTTVFIGPRQIIEYLDLKIRFRIDDFTQHGNIFQTAPLNEGVRFEISRSIGELIQGAVVYTKNRRARGFIVNKDLRIGKEYVLEIQLDLWGDMSVYLSGELVGGDRNVNLSISKFVLGNGYDGTRPFRGDVDLDYCKVFVSEASVTINKVDESKNWFSSLFRIKNVYFVFGVVILVVNILTSLRLFYFIWYEDY